MSAEHTEPARPADGPAGSLSPRPHAVAAVVPAATVPLSFFAAATAGLVDCGLARASRDRSDVTQRMRITAATRTDDR